MRGNYTNKFKPVGDSNGEDRMTSIWTEPKFGIGQRAILVRTDGGNVLWDCITYLDQATVDFIKEKGGLRAIVISHPHYYSTHLEWAKTFECPVIVAKDDEAWLNRADPDGRRRLCTAASEEVVEGVTAVKTGGHFPGSLVLLWKKHLMIADSFVTTPVSAMVRLTYPSLYADMSGSLLYTMLIACRARRVMRSCGRCRI